MSELVKIEKAMKRRAYVPSTDDPREELRRLVLEHKAITKAAVAIDNMARDKQPHDTEGMHPDNIKRLVDHLKCRLPEDVAVDLRETAKRQREKAAQLESAMKKELKKIPIYEVFLQHVPYLRGPVVSAYLIAEIDIHKATKPSSLRMFCGMAVVDGRIVRRQKGQKNPYNAEMRVRLFQAFGAMWQGSAKKTRAFPDGSSNKYLEIWTNYKTRAVSNGRIVDGKIQRIVNGELGDGKNDTVSAKGFVHSTGWHKACDVFLCDLYTVWRALEGLPVWPTYVEWITGYAHGGIPKVNEPEMLTLDDALSRVGDVAPRPLPVAAE